MVATIKVGKIAAATGTTVNIESGHTLHQPGGILQTVSTFSGTNFSTTSTTFVQLGVTLAITPKFATSKIYVQSYFSARHTGGDYAFAVGLGRGTANNNLALQRKFTRHASYRSGSDNISQSQMTVAMVDSPNTTAERHYGLMFHVHTGQGGTVSLVPNTGNVDGNDEFFIMCQEIAQ